MTSTPLVLPHSAEIDLQTHRINKKARPAMGWFLNLRLRTKLLTAFYVVLGLHLYLRGWDRVESGRSDGGRFLAIGARPSEPFPSARLATCPVTPELL